MNGVGGLLASCGHGISHTHYGNPDIVSDIVPVDMCVKGLIVAAYKFLLAEQQKVHDMMKATQDLEIFNCCNGWKRYLSSGAIVELCKVLVWKNPFESCVWLTEGSMTTSRIWHYYRVT